MAFRPYLFFGGNCREAFTRYQEIFGGELFVMGAGDMPSDEPVPAGKEDLVIHAALMFDGHLLMASDVFDTDAFAGVHGTYVNFTTPDLAEARRVYDALAEGAEVEMAFEPTFWSPGFGSLRDRFGTLWMVRADQPAGAA